MLTLAIILLVLWLLGLVAFHVTSNSRCSTAVSMPRRSTATSGWAVMLRKSS